MSESGGGGLFRPNKERGVWASPHDFVWACLNNALRIDNIYWLHIIQTILGYGYVTFLFWILVALLYAIPLFFFHSYLGQFSSSGYISALRITPIFKSLGYIALGVNLVVMAFYSILVAFSLLFLVYSLQPTPPWSCDAPPSWNTTWDPYNENTPYCEYISRYPEEGEYFTLLAVLSREFLRHKLTGYNIEVIGCLLVVWAALAFATCLRSEKIGIFLRYSTIVMVTLLVVVFTRMLFLPGVLDHIGVFKPTLHDKDWIWWMLKTSHITFMLIGPGWGSVLTLASYNKFKTDFVKLSWQIPICQFVIVILFGLLIDFTEIFLSQGKKHIIPMHGTDPWMAFTTIPSTLAALEFPHLWTWAFLIMILLGSFNLTLTQMFSTQTALLDEFDRLRPFRKLWVIGSSAVLALLSAPFCTEQRLAIIGTLFTTNAFVQCFISAILFIAVLWAYGHQRLKRDVEFMTNEVLPQWKQKYIKFVAPVLFVLMALSALLFAPRAHFYAMIMPLILAVVLPWVALLLYCVYRLNVGRGGCRQNFRRLTHPTEWHPVDREDQQRYVEALGNQDPFPDITTIMP